MPLGPGTHFEDHGCGKKRKPPSVTSSRPESGPVRAGEARAGVPGGGGDGGCPLIPPPRAWSPACSLGARTRQSTLGSSANTPLPSRSQPWECGSGSAWPAEAQGREEADGQLCLLVALLLRGKPAFRFQGQHQMLGDQRSRCSPEPDLANERAGADGCEAEAGSEWVASRLPLGPPASAARHPARPSLECAASFRTCPPVRGWALPPCGEPLDPHLC